MSEMEFPKFDSPVTFGSEASYTAQCTMLPLSPVLIPPVLNFEFYETITVRLLHIEKNI